MANTLPVAIIQEAPIFLNLQASLQKAEIAITKAAQQGAKLVAFAECWLTGYPVWLDFCSNAAKWDHTGAKAIFKRLRQNAVKINGPEVKRLQKLANNLDVIIIMGSHEKDGGTLYNTAITVIPQATTAFSRRKLVPTYTERLVWGRGDGSTLKTVDSQYGGIGTLICWEHWMPLLRATFHAQSETVHIAQWPIVNDVHLLASQHYAFEGRTPVLAAGSIMTKDDIINGYTSLDGADPEGLALLNDMPDNDGRWIHTGGSTVISSKGKILVEQVFEKEAIIMADIDLQESEGEFLTLDSAGHYSRPDIFQLNVNTRPQPNITYDDV